MTSAEREEALAFLKSPDLVERIGAAFETCGLVGEDTNRLAAYLACTSRKLDKPLAIIIQSTSAGGQEHAHGRGARHVPGRGARQVQRHDRAEPLLPGRDDLKHKILAIVEEEGAEKASYALKLLQSEGELTIASTGKDPTTGRMVTQEYHVEGPVMIFLTTTAIEIDEELQNRCLIADGGREPREQTERIHALQRKARTLEGLVAGGRNTDLLLTLLRNAQRLSAAAGRRESLRRRADVHDGADPHPARPREISDAHRRHHAPAPAPAARASTITDSGDRFDFIRVTLDDIALANRLAPELLGRSLDELPPQTRRLL